MVVVVAGSTSARPMQTCHRMSCDGRRLWLGPIRTVNPSTVVIHNPLLALLHAGDGAAIPAVATLERIPADGRSVGVRVGVRGCGRGEDDDRARHGGEPPQAKSQEVAHVEMLLATKCWKKGLYQLSRVRNASFVPSLESSPSPNRAGRVRLCLHSNQSRHGYPDGRTRRAREQTAARCTETLVRCDLFPTRAAAVKARTIGGRRNVRFGELAQLPGGRSARRLRQGRPRRTGRPHAIRRRARRVSAGWRCERRRAPGHRAGR
jgi:hypothetical protein